MPSIRQRNTDTSTLASEWVVEIQACYQGGGAPAQARQRRAVSKELPEHDSVRASSSGKRRRVAYRTPRSFLTTLSSPCRQSFKPASSLKFCTPRARTTIGLLSAPTNYTVPTCSSLLSATCAPCSLGQYGGLLLAPAAVYASPEMTVPSVGLAPTRPAAYLSPAPMHTATVSVHAPRCGKHYVSAEVDAASVEPAEMWPEVSDLQAVTPFIVGNPRLVHSTQQSPARPHTRLAEISCGAPRVLANTVVASPRQPQLGKAEELAERRAAPSTAASLFVCLLFSICRPTAHSPRVSGVRLGSGCGVAPPNLLNAFVAAIAGTQPRFASELCVDPGLVTVNYAIPTRASPTTLSFPSSSTDYRTTPPAPALEADLVGMLLEVRDLHWALPSSTCIPPGALEIFADLSTTLILSLSSDPAPAHPGCAVPAAPTLRISTLPSAAASALGFQLPALPPRMPCLAVPILVSLVLQARAAHPPDRVLPAARAIRRLVAPIRTGTYVWLGARPF
ncbi:hypothetical protein DFH06DRAFT_1318139 [Mycena polygramma]|nr:hypothetical protein DFH06DRAFT_1318139 [Mycena polygramma]